MAPAGESVSVQAAEAPYVLLVESQPDRELERAWLFDAPRSVLCCREPHEVEHCLALADDAVRAGHYVAGFLAYEAGYGLQPKLSSLAARAPEEHLVWLGIFDQRQELRGAALEQFFAERGAGEGAELSKLRFDTNEAEYAADFARIQQHLLDGDSYQVCHSFRCHFELSGSPAALFERLRRRQVTAFSALISTGDYSILSLSPELFFRKTGTHIELKPMKGTSRRGRDAEEDAMLTEQLRQDKKILAENVMIVDLLRNDIGRLARVGSVRAPELFSVERYETVLQMTSTVVAEVESSLGLLPLMQSLFPCGSVTGAPKLRSMQIIHALEESPRGIFCGSIGYVAPNHDACFNVAIRSLLLSREGKGTLGVGGGVVVDSTSKGELEECLLKAEFLTCA